MKLTKKVLPTVPEYGVPALIQLHDGRIVYWNGTEWDVRQYASFWTRALIFIVEANVVLWALYVAGMLVANATSDGAPPSDGLFAIVMLCAFVLMIGYFTVSFHGGATVGQRLAGLEIVEISTAQAPALGRSFVRTLILMLVFMPLGWIVLLVTGAGDRAGRALSDKAADTIVVKRNPESPEVVTLPREQVSVRTEQ